MPLEPRRSRAGLGLLVLACVTIITLDSRREESSSPVDPLRATVAAVLGPIESAASAAMRPITDLPAHFGDVRALREHSSELETANAELTRALRAADANDNRTAETRGIASLADSFGYGIVAAQVVALGPAQSFSRTVSIDVGSRDGVVPDLTVINADGLVGRVVSVSATTSTVLLMVDGKSTVGGRLGESMELGFLDGDGSVSGDGSLQLSLVDHTVSPKVGDAVVSWGSRNGAPYIAGVPIGEVVSVHSSPAELTETATIAPYVDFSSLDVVAVVTAVDDRSTTSQAQQGEVDR